MGKIYTFFSPLHGQCKTTATMIASSIKLNNCVLVHTQPTMADLENMLNSRNSKLDEVYSKLGINNLCYEFKAHELTEDDVYKNLFTLVGDEEGIINNLYLLPSATRNTTDDEREEILVKIITYYLPQFFDYVCVDLGAGYISPSKQAIMSSADKNFLVLTQSKPMLDTEKYKDIANLNIILGGFHPERKLTQNTFKKTYKKPVYIVPHCNKYADALSEGKTMRFFLSNEKMLEKDAKKKFKQDELYYFFNNLPDLRSAHEKENTD